MNLFSDDAFASGRNWRVEALTVCGQAREHANEPLRAVEEALWLAHERLRALVVVPQLEDFAPNQEHATAANAACVLAQTLTTARETLARWSRLANERALVLLNTQPHAIRDLVLLHVGARNRAHSGVCVAEVYAYLTLARHRTQDETDEARRASAEARYVTAVKLLTFMEGQAHMMACVRAHRVVRVVADTMREHRTVVHGMCGCGGCAFGFG